MGIYFLALSISCYKYPETTDYIEVNGMRLLYAVRGPEGGKPVVLLHGNGGSHKSMLTQAKQLAKAGYRYNSSLNPAFVPGRYMHLTTPRTIFEKNGLRQVPASVTPLIRFPLFWLALHLLPERLYRALVKRTLKHDGYFVTYFHPWEFSAAFAAEAKVLKVSPLIRRNLGTPMIERLDRLIVALKTDGNDFITIKELCHGGIDSRA